MNIGKNVYRSGSAARFVEDRLGAGFFTFVLGDLMAATGLSMIAARNQLLRMGDAVVRVSPRQPFYLIVSPEHRAFGAPPVDFWLGDYMEWLGHPYYLALQSAAAAHGSSQQAIMETQVITDRPRRPVGIGRIRLRFFAKANAGAAVVEQMRGTYAPLTISAVETTAFDLVRYGQQLGGIGRMVETISPLVSSMSTRSLRNVLIAEHEVATAQRLGFILQHLGADRLAKVVKEWLPRTLQKVPLSLPLRDGEPAPIDAMWGIVNNAGEAFQ